MSTDRQGDGRIEVLLGRICDRQNRQLLIAGSLAIGGSALLTLLAAAALVRRTGVPQGWVAAVAAGLVAAVWIVTLRRLKARWLTRARALRLADARLRLKDRLRTEREFATAPVKPALYDTLVEDLHAQVDEARLRTVFPPLTVRTRRTATLMGLAVLLLLVLLVVPPVGPGLVPVADQQPSPSDLPLNAPPTPDTRTVGTQSLEELRQRIAQLLADLRPQVEQLRQQVQPAGGTSPPSGSGAAGQGTQPDSQPGAAGGGVSQGTGEREGQAETRESSPEQAGAGGDGAERDAARDAGSSGTAGEPGAGGREAEASRSTGDGSRAGDAGAESGAAPGDRQGAGAQPGEAEPLGEDADAVGQPADAHAQAQAARGAERSDADGPSAEGVPSTTALHGADARDEGDAAGPGEVQAAREPGPSAGPPPPSAEGEAGHAAGEAQERADGAGSPQRPGSGGTSSAAGQAAARGPSPSPQEGAKAGEEPAGGSGGSRASDAMKEQLAKLLQNVGARVDRLQQGDQRGQGQQSPPQGAATPQQGQGTSEVPRSGASAGRDAAGQPTSPTAPQTGGGQAPGEAAAPAGVSLPPPEPQGSSGGQVAAGSLPQGVPEHHEMIGSETGAALFGEEDAGVETEESGRFQLRLKGEAAAEGSRDGGRPAVSSDPHVDDLEWATRRGDAPRERAELSTDPDQDHTVRKVRIPEEYEAILKAWQTRN